MGLFAYLFPVPFQCYCVSGKGLCWWGHWKSQRDVTKDCLANEGNKRQHPRHTHSICIPREKARVPLEEWFFQPVGGGSGHGALNTLAYLGIYIEFAFNLHKCKGSWLP